MRTSSPIYGIHFILSAQVSLCVMTRRMKYVIAVGVVGMAGF